MKRFMIPSLKMFTMVVLVAFFACSAIPALADSPIKLKKYRGEIELSIEDTSPFVLKGTASHLGRFTCYGEVDFLPGEEEGSLVGDGVTVFEAANGDLLVGIVIWKVDAEVEALRTGHIHFSWRDSVEFSDGTIVFSTGRFVESRPPGLVSSILMKTKHDTTKNSISNVR